MDAAPRLQVLRLSGEPTDAGRSAPAARRRGAPVAAPEAGNLPANPEVMAHIQRMGDVGCKLGEWLGIKGSRQWVEGFGMAPVNGIAPEDIEYQAVLGRNWLSPWVEGGKFCGSRGMALPLLGLKVRLKGAAAKAFECSYSATFVDGSAVGPVSGGETCEAESLAALEAFQIVIHPRAIGAKQPTQAPSAKRRRLDTSKPARASPQADAASAAAKPGRSPRGRSPARQASTATLDSSRHKRLATTANRAAVRCRPAASESPRAGRRSDRTGCDQTKVSRLKFLFVHQNFPAQFLHIVRHLVAAKRHEVVFISEPNANEIAGRPQGPLRSSRRWTSRKPISPRANSTTASGAPKRSTEPHSA